MTTTITVREAAHRVARSEQLIRKLISNGRLRSELENGRYMLDPNEVVEFFQHQAATRRGAIAQISVSSQPSEEQGGAQVALLERQIAMLERELEYSKKLHASEREARTRLEVEMSAILKEIRAYMDGSQNNLLTRFFKK
jgi:hypothetical protein